MTPREFVGRIIDLFTFDIKGGWSEVRPKNLLSAAMCLRLGEGQCELRGPKKRFGHSLDIDNYTLELETEEALDLTVIRATMFGGNGASIQATICFNYDGDTGALFCRSSEPDMFGSWRTHLMTEEEQLSMLAYLILRTNFSVRNPVEE